MISAAPHEPAAATCKNHDPANGVRGPAQKPPYLPPEVPPEAAVLFLFACHTGILAAHEKPGRRWLGSGRGHVALLSNHGLRIVLSNVFVQPACMKLFGLRLLKYRSRRCYAGDDSLTIRIAARRRQTKPKRPMLARPNKPATVDGSGTGSGANATPRIEICPVGSV